MIHREKTPRIFAGCFFLLKPADLADPCGPFDPPGKQDRGGDAQEQPDGIDQNIAGEHSPPFHKGLMPLIERGIEDPEHKRQTRNSP